ncbi:MAG TPA: hypothetical protein VFS21_28515 [Roseiflexaceae bacterium]|nr:hypothetical protein [Roseiflexaceae bacterium]
MSTLKLTEFRCLQETNQWQSSDSPYFIVFIGHFHGADPKSEVVVVRNESWDGKVDAKENFTVNMKVADNITTSTFVLVALLEEDDGPDFNSGEERLTKLRESMKKFFKEFGTNVPILEPIAKEILDKFKQDLKKYRYNDDRVDVQRLDITTNTGRLPILTFNGGEEEGGVYRVRFEMV